MIGKQFQSSNFKPILEYVHNKSGAKLISSNMVSEEPSKLRKEFEVFKGYRNRVKKCVYHISLSANPSEKLSDEKWAKIGKAYLEGMGFEANQYVMYRHTDRQHEHIHIIASRVKVTDGSVVSDSWDYTRSQKLIRELEKQFDLLAPSKESKSKNLVNTQETSVKNKLKQIIKESLDKSPSLDEFINSLKVKDVSVRLRKSPDKTIKGISYKLQGVVAFQGNQLGKEYSWKSIENHLTKTIVSSETPINMSINMNDSKQKSLENRKLDEQKKILREKYLNLISKLQNIREYKDVKSKELDIGVAILALRKRESLDEVKQLISQSDAVREWKEELALEEYLKIAREYIEEIVKRAEIYLEKQRSQDEGLSI